MVKLANLRNDEHHTDEADEFPRLSPAEKMEVMESMGLTPKGSCTIHTKRYGLFGKDIEACDDFKWATRLLRPYPSKVKPPMTCGSCRFWHFEGIGE